MGYAVSQYTNHKKSRSPLEKDPGSATFVSAYLSKSSAIEKHPYTEHMVRTAITTASKVCFMPKKPLGRSLRKSSRAVATVYSLYSLAPPLTPSHAPRSGGKGWCLCSGYSCANSPQRSPPPSALGEHTAFHGTNGQWSNFPVYPHENARKPSDVHRPLRYESGFGHTPHATSAAISST